MSRGKGEVKSIMVVTATFLAIFASHYVTFMSLYPGICYYDLGAQIDQYVSGAFCTNHPLIHTLFEGVFYSLYGDHNKGYAYVTLIQLLIVDGSMTYALSFLWKKYGSLVLYVCSVLFYALMPINSLLAVSHTKDILFAAFALIFFVDIFRMCYHEDMRPGTYVRIVLNAALMLLFRNNALYAMAVLILVLLLVYGPELVKTKTLGVGGRLLAVAVISILLMSGANRLLINMTDASAGSIKEMASIPAQIMGRTYNTVATDEEKEIILKYIKSPEEYNYYLSDPMKKDLPFDGFDSSCKHFLLDSAVIAVHHPLEALRAVLYNVQGFIDPFHMPYSKEHFFLVSREYRGGAVYDSRISSLGEWYASNMSRTGSLSESPLVILFNLGLYVWIMIIGMVIHIRRYDFKNAMPYIFAILYLGTLMLGPGAIIRYGYLYILMAPVVVGTAIWDMRTRSEAEVAVETVGVDSTVQIVQEEE